MSKVNVLITAASRRVGLVRAFRQAVERCGKGHVITTDINSLSPALYFGDRNHIVPLTTAPHYIPIIESICDVEDIHLIIPTIDDELPIFGRSRSRFERQGVWVAASGDETANICNDKLQTYEFATQNGIEAPQTWSREEVDLAKLSYPVIVKPRSGRGSIQVFTANNERELLFFMDYVPDSIVQEFVRGTEFTVDVCSDFNGQVLSVVPRERVVIRAGVSDKGVTRNNKHVIDFSRRVAESLHIVGPANIQCMWDGTRVTLIEVNPRFSGGIPLTIASGADFPTWLVQLRSGKKIRQQIGRFQADLTMMSFEDNVFATQDQLNVQRNKEPRRFARTDTTASYVN